MFPYIDITLLPYYVDSMVKTDLRKKVKIKKSRKKIKLPGIVPKIVRRIYRPDIVPTLLE